VRIERWVPLSLSVNSRKALPTTTMPPIACGLLV
jgi:hypothetical protein